MLVDVAECCLIFYRNGRVSILQQCGESFGGSDGHVVYNTGHIANEKTRFQNTTDAAAHSVAMLQSRDLNFQAYMNRAMIANQVAVR